MLQYLDEAHAMETALVTNLGAHASMAPGGEYKRRLESHRVETLDQVERIDQRRKELGQDGRGIAAGAVGLIRDAIGQALVLTKGPVDMVRSRGAERILKNAKDEIATEALEIATYEALEAAAKAAGDPATAKLAVELRKQEEQMLADLRALLPDLAAAAIADRTQVSMAQAKAAVAKSSSTTSTRSTSTTRSTSSTRKTTAKRETPKAKPRAKASAASRSTSSRTTKASSATRKPATRKASTTRKSSTTKTSAKS